MKKCSIGILALVMVLTTYDLKAQLFSSPYSNFGLGNLVDTRSSSIKALGKSYAAYRDFTTINYDNPASYTAFDTLSFVLDVSMELESRSLYTSASQNSSTNCGFGSLQIGFPIAKWAKMSAGLIPTSNVGYLITTDVVDDMTGHKKYRFIGSGGVSNAYAGLGIQVGQLSVGANFSYLFGTILKTHTLLYPDSSFFFNTKILDELYVNSIYANFGIQYNAKLSKDLYLCFGATYTPEMHLNSQQSIASYTYTVANDIETVRDTVFVSSGDGNVMTPQKIGGGVMLRKLNRYKLLLNFEWQEWSKFQIYGAQQGTYGNSYKASIGYEHSPRTSTVSSYFKWVKYRMGAYFENTPLIVDGTPINQYGVTFGLSFPIIRSASTVNLTFDIGNRGTKSNNLIQETYINATLAFSLYDTWFYRIKYK